MKSIVSRGIILAIAMGCYLLSLAMPAFYFGFPTTYDTYTGWECLISPVNESPMVLLFFPFWWANPFFLLGAIYIYCRRDKSALVCGIIAMLLACPLLLVTIDPHDIAIRIGYWFWLASIGTIPIGAYVLMRMRGASDATSEPETSLILQAFQINEDRAITADGWEEV